MTLTELRYIVALARERHFGRAADKCNVSQPTLSVAVKKLEDELGVALFERSAGDVRATPIGTEVVAQAERVLAEAARVAEVAAGGKDPLAGPLRLGVIYTIGPWLLPALVPRVKALAPHMPLFIAEGYTENLLERLKAAELDVLVLALPIDEPGLVAQPVYDEAFRTLVPVAHPWANLKSLRPAQLLDEPLLMLGAGNCFSRPGARPVHPGQPGRVAAGAGRQFAGDHPPHGCFGCRCHGDAVQQCRWHTGRRSAAAGQALRRPQPDAPRRTRLALQLPAAQGHRRDPPGHPRLPPARHARSCPIAGSYCCGEKIQLELSGFLG
jgi:DNA-binding transcriptional LysR family regulator